MLLGKRIKELRLERGLTQAELAKLQNTTKQNIYKYEKSVVLNIPLQKVEQLAEALHCTPAYLMGWIDEDTNKKNIALADIVSKLRADDKLLEFVDKLCKLPDEQLQAIRILFSREW